MSEVRPRCIILTGNTCPKCKEHIYVGYGIAGADAVFGWYEFCIYCGVISKALDQGLKPEMENKQPAKSCLKCGQPMVLSYGMKDGEPFEFWWCIYCCVGTPYETKKASEDEAQSIDRVA